jgi:hypothetical protein
MLHPGWWVYAGLTLKAHRVFCGEFASCRGTVKAIEQNVVFDCAGAMPPSNGSAVARVRAHKHFHLRYACEVADAEMKLAFHLAKADGNRLAAWLT